MPRKLKPRDPKTVTPRQLAIAITKSVFARGHDHVDHGHGWTYGPVDKQNHCIMGDVFNRAGWVTAKNIGTNNSSALNAAQASFQRGLGRGVRGIASTAMNRNDVDTRWGDILDELHTKYPKAFKGLPKTCPNLPRKKSSA